MRYRAVGAVLSAGALAAALSGVLLHIVTKPHRATMEQSLSREKENGSYGAYDSYEKEPLEITAEDGYVLHGVLLKNPGKRYVIITHGYKDTRLGSLKYAHIYYRRGYNVYIYDLRHHGENEETFCSMGYRESRDIVTIAKFLKDRYGQDIVLGLHGESLGSASSILALGQYPDFDFCVSDCGFADLGKLLEYLCGRLIHLPQKISHLASLACRVRYRYRLDEIRPVDVFSGEIRTPVLFIHGEADTFIPPEHGKMMYEAAGAKKELALFPGAEHAQSYFSDRERYERVVGEFLEKYV